MDLMGTFPGTEVRIWTYPLGDTVRPTIPGEKHVQATLSQRETTVTNLPGLLETEGFPRT